MCDDVVCFSYFNHPNTILTCHLLAMILLLMSIRAFVLPKYFSEAELEALGDPTPT